MRQKLFSYSGMYSPTFLKMHVDTSQDLSQINNLENRDSATFFHEYTHFLQDVSTTYGLMNIGSVVDFLKEANNQILEKGEDAFHVPFSLDSLQDKRVKANTEIRKVYFGSSAHINIKKVDEVCKTTERINSLNKDIPKIKIKYSDENESNQVYEFGGECICESMAFLIEQQIYPDELENPPTLPYYSAKQVANNLYPGIEENNLIVIALCDVSLLSFHPGNFFFYLLEKMKNEGFYPRNPENIYEFALNEKIDFENFHNLNQLVIGMGNQASSQLSSYFTTNIFEGNTIWVNNLISRAIDFRLKNPQFIIDLARMGPINNNVCFASLFHNLGTPMMVNNEGKGFFYSPLCQYYNIRPEYLWVINQLFKNYTEGNKLSECELINFCNNSALEKEIDEFTDDRCFNNPWERASDSSLCPYAQVWKSWGLKGKKLKIKDT